jgi:pimeloyl-ACP methyl ester carboxylesterase
VAVPSAIERRIGLGDGAATTLSQWGTRGLPILCIHGITSSRASWTRFAARFSSEYRIFAYDQRGHGDSARVLGPMSLDRGARDLAAVVAAIGEPIDVLVGHSWGGTVALRGGAELRPRRVVAIDPMMRVLPGTFAADYVEDLREVFSLQGKAREGEIARMYASAHPVDRDAKLHAMRGMSIGPLEALGRENHVDEGGWDLRGLLVAYPVPLLLALAGVESVVSADDLAFVRERGGVKVTIRIFEGEGHNLQRTAFDDFAGTVGGFLANGGR